MEYEYQNKDLRKLQLKEMAILKEVIQICEENNLRYFALGGTLLGAVRHKGFIPWDDDIDLGIPRKDYEEFIRVAPQKLSENLKLYYYKNELNPGTYYMQIMDTNTKVISHAGSKPRELNVWLDIFPLDGMPNNRLKRMYWKYRLLYQKMLIKFSCIDTNVGLKHTARPLHERLLIRFCLATHIGRGWDTRKLMHKLDRLLKKYPYDDADYIVNFYGRYKFNEMFPRDYYREGAEYPFEDVKIRGPIEYEKVLEQMYGDYMKIPDMSTVGMHHSIEIVDV